MIVDRRLLHGALIRVLKVVSADDSAAVHGEDLEREWSRMTGLRRSDLESAVRDMVDRGHLCVQRAAGTSRDYELTPAGRSELLWQGVLLNTGDWLVFAGARARTWIDLLRGRRGAQPSVERRQGSGGASAA